MNTMNSETKMCWLCFKNSSTLENICTLDSDNVRIADKLIYCLPELESNAKKNVILICNICHDKLNMFYDFKRSAIRNNKHFINYVSKKKEKATHNATKSSEEPVCVFVKSEVHIDEETENKLINAETCNFKLNDVSSNDIEDPLDMIQDICLEIDESVILPETPAISPEIEVQKIIYNPEKQAHHTKEKPFTCTICQRNFSQKGNLMRHYKVHNGAKPFTCSVCQSKFSQEQDMYIHMRKHIGKKPISCTVCKKKFAMNSRLCHHSQLYGEKFYKCGVCQKQFCRKRDIVIHIRMHTGEKPYSCEICQKQFKHRKAMSFHIKVHNQGRREKCQAPMH